MPSASPNIPSNSASSTSSSSPSSSSSSPSSSSPSSSSPSSSSPSSSSPSSSSPSSSPSSSSSSPLQPQTVCKAATCSSDKTLPSSLPFKTKPAISADKVLKSSKEATLARKSPIKSGGIEETSTSKTVVASRAAMASAVKADSAVPTTSLRAAVCSSVSTGASVLSFSNINWATSTDMVLNSTDREATLATKAAAKSSGIFSKATSAKASTVKASISSAVIWSAPSPSAEVVVASVPSSFEESTTSLRATVCSSVNTGASALSLSNMNWATSDDKVLNSTDKEATLAIKAAANSSGILSGDTSAKASAVKASTSSAVIGSTLSPSTEVVVVSAPSSAVVSVPSPAAASVPSSAVVSVPSSATGVATVSN